MPLRLITGPANAGKTGIVLTEALAAAAAGASPIVAVSNLADVRRLESELSGKAPLGVRVVTLRQLAAEIWALHGDGRRIVDGPSRDALLKKVLSRGPSAPLEEAAQTPGFNRLIARLAANSTATGAPGKASEGSDSALLALIDEYRRELIASGLVEARWLGELIASAEPFTQGPVGVMRFDALAVDEIQLITSLAAANHVTVALTWEHMFAPTRANDGAVRYLAGIAAEHVRVEDAPVTGEIQRLARGLYAGPVSIASTGAVVAGLASGAEAEAALTARLVADEIADGVAAERIVVALPSVGCRADLMNQALLSYGVSVEFDITEGLLTTNFGRAWRALLSLAVGKGGRSEALTFVASPYSGVSRGAVHELDRRWRQNRVTDPAALLATVGGLGNDCERIVKLVRRLARRGLSAAALEDWQGLADAMLCSATADSVGESVGRSASRDAAAHQALNSALGQMASATATLGARDVLGAVSAIPVRERSEETPGRVQVCDFRRVGARRFDVVILAGLTDGELPLAASDSAEERLRSDFARQLEAERGDRARLEFYSLVSRARRRLYLVRQEADSEGRKRRASGLWEDVMDAYGSPGRDEEDAADPSVPCESLARADIEDLAPALTRGRRRQRERAAALRFSTRERGEVTSVEGLSALDCLSVFSATEVETYLSCPYKWFHERVVRPEEIDKALDARELGTRAHRLLAEFYRRVAALPDRERVTPEWLNEALQLFDEVAAAESSTAPKGLSEEMQVARTTSWGRTVVDRDATFLPGFVPELVEFGFGVESPFWFAGHQFRGRIDRIDTCPSSVFVTDYKSSSDVTKLEKLETEGKVQMIIYACAAESALGKPASGSVYRSMRTGRLHGFWRADLLGDVPVGMCEDEALGAAGFAELVARTEERVAQAIEDMHAGRVPRKPGVTGACNYCSISRFCDGASG